MRKHILVFVLTMAALLMTACGSQKGTELTTPPISLSEATETASIPQAKEQPDSARSFLLKVLQNQESFFSGEYGVVTLDAYCEKAEEHTDTGIFITQYAFVDLDADGQQEAIVDLQLETGKRLIYIILKYDSAYNQVYGTEMTEHDVSSLKEDGSFLYSVGIPGGRWSKMRWQGNSMTWSIVEAEDGSGKNNVQWYPYTTVNPSPRKPDGALKTKPLPIEASTWQEAYSLYLLTADRAKYLEDPDGLRDYPETDIYLGLHDFDSDGTPELIFGDGVSAAVFTFLDGRMMKIADICYPGTVWCVNGICFGENSMAAVCNGSGGSAFVVFGCMDGAYQLGRYTQLCDLEPTINGRACSVEDIQKIHTTDWQILENETKERIRLVCEEGQWVLLPGSGERIVVDSAMDFGRFLW